MLSYNIVLKLRTYIKSAKLNFNSIISQLCEVQIVLNKITDAIEFATIPKVNSNLQTLFDNTVFKLKNRIYIYFFS